MNTKEILIIILSILSFSLGILPYLIATIKGKVQPNRITWLFWTVPLITVFAQWQNNILTWASLPVFLAGFGPLLVFVATFYNKKAYWKLERFDYLFAFLGGITLIIYFLTQDVFLTIVFSILTDFLVAIPTIKKAYFNPESELITPFLVFIILTFISFFMMDRYDFEEMAFPVYLFLIDFTITILLRKQIVNFFKTNYRKKK